MKQQAEELFLLMEGCWRVLSSLMLFGILLGTVLGTGGGGGAFVLMGLEFGLEFTSTGVMAGTRMDVEICLGGVVTLFVGTLFMSIGFTSPVTGSARERDLPESLELFPMSLVLFVVVGTPGKSSSVGLVEITFVVSKFKRITGTGELVDMTLTFLLTSEFGVERGTGELIEMTFEFEVERGTGGLIELTFTFTLGVQTF